MTLGRLLERDRRLVWHPFGNPNGDEPPLAVARAKGIYLYTEEGRPIVDGISSWWVNIHGHCHDRLNRALASQAARLEHVAFAGCTHPPAVELAERLVSVLPRGLRRVFYSDDGSTAVEVALKIASQYWKNLGERGRDLFITLRHAYHGDTVGAMSVSEDSPFTAQFTYMLFSVVRAESPYCYHCPLGLERPTCGTACLGDLALKLERYGERVAGVLVEPMLQGAGGMIVWPADFLRGVRELCDRHKVLMIADEVLTGFGRTGRMFACDHACVTPDIICLSKALTAGYLPLAATVATDEVYESFCGALGRKPKSLYHGHSYTANALACAVALESLKMFEDFDVLSRVREIELELIRGLRPLKSLSRVADVRVIGGVGAIELKADVRRSDDNYYLDPVGARLGGAFLERGVLLRPLGRIIYFMPPYVITDSELRWVMAEIGYVLGRLS